VRARAVLIALVTELGLLLAVAVQRPAGVRIDPAPAAAPEYRTNAVVTAEPILERRADLDRGWGRCGAV
jgi:hypothetical protein